LGEGIHRRRPHTPLLRVVSPQGDKTGHADEEVERQGRRNTVVNVEAGPSSQEDTYRKGWVRDTSRLLTSRRHHVDRRRSIGPRLAPRLIVSDMHLMQTADTALSSGRATMQAEAGASLPRRSHASKA
jgi:hypothetical protein